MAAVMANVEPDAIPADATFTVSDGRLVMTCRPESLNVCKHCPDLHVLVLEVASKENLRQLAVGLAHLAEHLP
jgi:hypothetical protein